LKRLALLLLLLAPIPEAHAAGMALRWNSCLGQSNRNFACDRSTGSELLVGSFQSPATIEMSGIEVYMHITTADGVIPSWWQMFSMGACRNRSMSLSVDVSGETECDDPWLGQATGLFAPHSIDNTNGIDLRMVCAVPVPAIQTITPGRTYAAFLLTINHARSNGAAACEGCSKPACVSIDRMVLTTPQKKPVELTEGLAGMGGAASVATWQGGTPTCGAGLAKPSTWSELKKRFK